jgi:hypothetical protein
MIKFGEHPRTRNGGLKTRNSIDRICFSNVLSCSNDICWLEALVRLHGREVNIILEMTSLVDILFVITP